MSDSIAPPSYPFRVRASVLAREVGGEMVILDVEDGVYYGLDEVGTRIWQLLAGGMSLLEVQDRLAEEYEVEPDILRRDLNRLIGELQERGLIDVASE